MGPVVTSVTATFSAVGEGGEYRKLSISSGHRGMVRGWFSTPWPFMNDAYYVIAQVGRYMVQILRTLSSVFVKYQTFTVARLYLDGSFVSAANKIVGEALIATAEDVEEKVVRLTKVEPCRQPGGFSGSFRDGNVGYVLELLKNGSDEGWTFKIVHERAVWSKPTSAPGPDETGKSGCIEAFSGGATCEKYEVHESGGQVQILDRVLCSFSASSPTMTSCNTRSLVQ